MGYIIISYLSTNQKGPTGIFYQYYGPITAYYLVWGKWKQYKDIMYHISSSNCD